MIKRPKISKHEIIADAIFLFLSMLVSGVVVLIFDYHWSFYPGETIFPPSKHIFQSLTPYYVGILVGGIIGFFVIKLLYFAFSEEERASEEIGGEGKKRDEITIKIKKGKTYLD